MFKHNRQARKALYGSLKSAAGSTRTAKLSWYLQRHESGDSGKTVTAQSAPNESLQMVRELLSAYSWPQQPKLFYTGMRHTGARMGATEVGSAVITVTGEVRTPIGVQLGFDVPVEIRDGQMLEPSVMLVNGHVAVISQSAIDNLINNNSTFADQPLRGMYQAPMDGVDNQESPRIPRRTPGMFHMSSKQSALRDFIRTRGHKGTEKLAQMDAPSGVNVTSIERMPAEIDEEPGMPTFAVSGSFNGQPFEVNLSIELDGRDMEAQHVAGVDIFGTDVDSTFFDAQEQIFVAIGNSPAYTEAMKEYEASYTQHQAQMEPAPAAVAPWELEQMQGHTNPVTLEQGPASTRPGLQKCPSCGGQPHPTTAPYCSSKCLKLDQQTTHFDQRRRGQMQQPAPQQPAPQQPAAAPQQGQQPAKPQQKQMSPQEAIQGLQGIVQNLAKEMQQPAAPKAAQMQSEDPDDFDNGLGHQSDPVGYTDEQQVISIVTAIVNGKEVTAIPEFGGGSYLYVLIDGRVPSAAQQPMADLAGDLLADATYTQVDLSGVKIDAYDDLYNLVKSGEIDQYVVGRRAQMQSEDPDVHLYGEDEREEASKPSKGREQHNNHPTSEFMPGAKVKVTKKLSAPTRGGPRVVIESGASGHVIRDMDGHGNEVYVGFEDGRKFVIPARYLSGGVKKKSQAEPEFTNLTHPDQEREDDDVDPSMVEEQQELLEPGMSVRTKEEMMGYEIENIRFIEGDYNGGKTRYEVEVKYAPDGVADESDGELHNVTIAFETVPDLSGYGVDMFPKIDYSMSSQLLPAPILEDVLKYVDENLTDHIEYARTLGETERLEAEEYERQRHDDEAGAAEDRGDLERQKKKDEHAFNNPDINDMIGDEYEWDEHDRPRKV
jgi:hypothetical protein